MARLRKSDIVETWQSNKDPERRYFVTRNHRVVRVIGEAFASGKMMYIMYDKSSSPINFSGTGRFAHADNDPQVREFLAKFTTRKDPTDEQM